MNKKYPIYTRHSINKNQLQEQRVPDGEWHCTQEVDQRSGAVKKTAAPGESLYSWTGEQGDDYLRRGLWELVDNGEAKAVTNLEKKCAIVYLKSLVKDLREENRRKAEKIKELTGE